MKKRIAWCCKAALAGCCAFIIMTLFCIFYFNVPVHYPNSNGSTDYIWLPNSFYSRGTEGFAWGKINNEGFVNQTNYVDGMDIDVLIMGSSHMEAYQIAQSESVTGRLGAFMQDKAIYNIGVSGHNFLTCCCNFEAAVDRYRPSDYVVFETSRLSFTTDELNSILDGSLPEIPDHSSGIVGLLQKNQFLRLVYNQFRNSKKKTADDGEDFAENNQFQSAEDSSDALNTVLSLLNKIASEYGTKIIIFYHPSTQINSDGSLLLPEDKEYRVTFSDLCEKNGIIFLDMTDRFEYEYEKNYILPHGFINSSVGSGHLNKYGHEMIADELYKIMS